MRISGIEKWLGGADNVSARDVIRGEQLVFRGKVQDQDGNSINITDFTISATAEFYTADVTITSSRSGDTVTVNSFTAASKADATLTTTFTDAVDGEFTVLIPEDLVDDSDTADLDAQNAIFTAVVYLKYADGGTPETIRKSRLLLFYRHAA